MRSFLSVTDLSGKTVLPFITHGGFGAGDAMDEAQRVLPGADLAGAFVLECDQERNNLNALRNWLAGIGVSPPH